VADLLKCLPDRSFPYRIFDAASGRVLQSVSGDEDTDASGTETTDSDAMPVSHPAAELSIAAPARMIAGVETLGPLPQVASVLAAVAAPPHPTRVDDRTLPRTAAAASPRFPSAPIGSDLPRLATAPIATMPVGRAPTRDRLDAGHAAARGLGNLTQPGLPPGVAPTTRRSAGQIVSLLTRAPGPSITRLRSTGEMVKALTGGGTATAPARPQSTAGQMLRRLSPSGGDTPRHRRNESNRTSTTAEVLRGALRR